MALPPDRLKRDDAGAGATAPDLLDGIIRGAEGESTIKVLNPQRLLRDEFSRLGFSSDRGLVGVSVSAATAAAPAVIDQWVSLVSFDLGKQEYALPLDRVREIIQLPDHISEVPRAETAVLGVVTLRDKLLPLVSLRALLGLPANSGRDEPAKVVVLSMGNGAVGVIADRTRQILRVRSKRHRSRADVVDARRRRCRNHVDLSPRSGEAVGRLAVAGSPIPIRSGSQAVIGTEQRERCFPQSNRWKHDG